MGKVKLKPKDGNSGNKMQHPRSGIFHATGSKRKPGGNPERAILRRIKMSRDDRKLFLKKEWCAVGSKAWLMERRIEMSARRRLEKVEKSKIARQKLKVYGDCEGTELVDSQVKEAVTALLKLLKNSETNPFNNDWKDIYLQITSYRAPKTGSREIRIVLPHSLLSKSAEVCLFTKDLEKGKRIDHEPTLEYMKEILNKNGVTRINEVITVRQLKTEYDQFELKRALCSRYDFFLSDARVSGHVSHLLGKTFYDRRKIPVPIKLDATNLKECVDVALRKSSFRVNAYGTLFTLKVANTRHSWKKIYENIMAACAALRECFPGNWNNISSLMIKGAKSLPIPIYVSVRKASAVEIPVVYKKPKLATKMIGDLYGNIKVAVSHTGDVRVVAGQKELREEAQEIMEARAKKKKEKNMKRKGHHVPETDSEEEEGHLPVAKHEWLQDEYKNESEFNETGEDNYETIDGGEVYEETDEEKEGYGEASEDENREDGADINDDDNNEDGNIDLDDIEQAYLENWTKSQDIQKSSKKSRKE